MKNDITDRSTEGIIGFVRAYFRWSYDRFVKTPERALNKAHDAALKIKALEDEYFEGKIISARSKDYSKTVLDCFQTDLNKYLNLIKIYLAEFKISSLFFGNPDNITLEKLSFIDEIAKKYAREKDLNRGLQVYKSATTKSSQMEISTVDRDRQLSSLESKTSNAIDRASFNLKTGALPRSIGRTFKKISNDFDDRTEEQIVENYRRSRKTTKLAIRTLLLFIIIPLLTQQLSKNIFLLPAVEKSRSTEEAKVFLNREMEEEAFKELQNFEETLKFTNLLTKAPHISPEEIEEKVKKKAQELAEEFKQKGNIAIGNVFADLFGLVAFAFVVIFSQPGIAAIKSLIDSVVYDLSDSAKAFIIILFTDIFVGFHSPHGWEVLLEGFANHLGVEPNRSAISLFIATFPVILDTVFKYWIFRYLNRMSPSAVATLKEMNE